MPATGQPLPRRDQTATPPPRDHDPVAACARVCAAALRLETEAGHARAVFDGDAEVLSLLEEMVVLGSGAFRRAQRFSRILELRERRG